MQWPAAQRLSGGPVRRLRGRIFRPGVRGHALPDVRPHGADDRRHGGRPPARRQPDRSLDRGSFRPTVPAHRLSERWTSARAAKGHIRVGKAGDGYFISPGPARPAGSHRSLARPCSSGVNETAGRSSNSSMIQHLRRNLLKGVPAALPAKGPPEFRSVEYAGNGGAISALHDRDRGGRMRRVTRRAVLGASASGLLVPPWSMAQGASANPSGLTDTEISRMSAAFSGPSARSRIDSIAGARAYSLMSIAAGGVRGRRSSSGTYDDGYQPTLGVGIRSVILKDKVVRPVRLCWHRPTGTRVLPL